MKYKFAIVLIVADIIIYAYVGKLITLFCSLDSENLFAARDSSVSTHGEVIILLYCYRCST